MYASNRQVVKSCGLDYDNFELGRIYGTYATYWTNWQEPQLYWSCVSHLHSAVLSRDRTTVVSNLILREKLTTVSRLSYLGGRFTKDGSTSVERNTGNDKARATY